MTYTCRSCRRDVDPDLEPSPGEPVRCADCMADLDRELADGLRAWGIGGVA